jgi:hypothetical protein
MIVGAVVAALVLGFLAGLFAFRVKSRWCPECGATTSAERPQPAGARRHPRPPASINQDRF